MINSIQSPPLDADAIQLPPIINDALLQEFWQIFLSTEHIGEYSQAWLVLLCQQLTNVNAGLLLLAAEEGNSYIPTAVWPIGKYDQQYLTDTAQEALTERQGVITRLENKSDIASKKADAAYQIDAYIAYPIEVDHVLKGAVVLDVTAKSEAELTAKLRQLHWGIAWLIEFFSRHHQSAAVSQALRVTSIMESMANILPHKELQQSLFALVNDIANRLQCDRVSIGVEKNKNVVMTAISRSAWFEKNANIVRQLVAAMEEARDRNQTVRLEEGIAPKLPAHEALLKETAGFSVLTVPLARAGQFEAVLLLERNVAGAFTDEEVKWVEALASLVTPLISVQKLANRTLWQHLIDLTKKLGERLFGEGYLTWKVISFAMVIAILVLSFCNGDYRIAAKTVIEGEVQRVAAAPFEGFIAKSFVRAGDSVKAEQTLCLLDDKDLQLERAKWSGEREQHMSKLREAIADRDLSATQVVGAQLSQSEAQLALVEQKLARTKITAPFDGVVVSGDLSQMIGSPVELGKKLFEIAPLNSYRVIIQVDERDIAYVKQGQQGKLMISGLPGDAIDFTVKQVTPVATAQDGRNFFRVEAHLKSSSTKLRPGMEGVGKVSVGSHRLIWIYTHSFIDWLRLSFWNWIP